MSDRLVEALEDARPAFERISAEVWDLCELSLGEIESAEVHARELEAAGFEVSSGTSGIETAFVAERRLGDGPVVGFLSEYDALPGLGNEAVPCQQPRADGKTSGHGCGHNLLGAALTSAAIASASLLETEGLAGTVRVYWCAAEESEGAKVYTARDGLFDDVDACVHWHPWSVAAVMNMRLAAANTIRLAFCGRTAHPGMEPWSGRSALHALELAAHGINLMREHLEPTARSHYIFEEAGEAPNVVPDYARMLLLIRDVDRTHVRATTEWVRQTAAGAAQATQTQSEVEVFFGLHDLLPNAPLAERMQATSRRRRPGVDGRGARVREGVPGEHGSPRDKSLHRRRAAAARGRDRRLLRRGGRELERADDGGRHADRADRGEHAHVGGDGLRGDVDRAARGRSRRVTS